jgi:hypothetical protein
MSNSKSPDKNKSKEDDAEFNAKFNAEFEKQKADNNKKNKDNELKRLNSLNQEVDTRTIWDLKFNEMLIGVKDTWFEILDDILIGNISSNIFIKKNRLFFIGLTIIVIVIILYIYDVLTRTNDIKKNNSNIKEIHHYYHKRNSTSSSEPTNALSTADTITSIETESSE